MKHFDGSMHRLQVIDRAIEINRSLDEVTVYDLSRRNGGGDHGSPGFVLIRIVEIFNQVHDLSQG